MRTYHEAMEAEDRREAFQPVIDRMNFTAWMARQETPMSCPECERLEALLQEQCVVERAIIGCAAIVLENRYLRDKLQRVRDWLRHAANSEGGIAQEIDELLAATQTMREGKSD